MRIQQLDSSVINKIAAGEVIERPASVVKELLENSLDALATRIEVDIVAGGTELIRTVDDGEGIGRDDLPLAVASHATSKIRSADDLFRVRTMGFRGEALASIAEVSRLRLRSRPADAGEGYELEVDLGRMGPLQPCGCAAGTLIEVRNLFGNTPVRRKFLKATSTEFGHISEQFTRIALASPRLHMVLRHNGKVVYELPATERLLERLQLFYGSELAEQLIAVESEVQGVRLWGYVAHPKQSKSTRKGQYLFLNGRWIQDRSLQHALGEAYRGLLMVGRYPVAFLFLEMSPDLVDVNVHPTKAEVRFRDGQQLYRQMLSALRTRFLGMNLDSQLRVPVGAGVAVRAAAPDPEQQLALQSEFADWAKGELMNWSPSAPPALEADEHEEEEDEAFLPAAFPAEGGGWEPGSTAFAPPHFPVERPAASPPQPEARLSGEPAPITGRAMQVHDCYLVVETNDGLTVIDQHALHERIMYEHLRERVLSGSVESQRLLVPHTVEVSPREAALLAENSELLDRFGLGIEDFGQGTVVVTKYPVMLARADLAQLVRDIVEHLDGAGQTVTRRDILDELLHMMSCKAAIKAGQRLSPEEIESLLAQRHLVDDAHHCPHGRPTALVLTRSDLDRQFGRLG